MKLALENVDLSSSSGPNSFAKKIIPSLEEEGCELVGLQKAEVSLCFIESYMKIKCPRILRLDGIYFNTKQDYKNLNLNIKKTFNNSAGVVFQSEFNKRLITKFFGEKDNNIVIHNGADIETIEQTPPMQNDKFNNIWCAASSWRPHKRLKENIRYFLEHKEDNDLLIIAGHVKPQEQIKDSSIVYFGNLQQKQLYSLYKASKYFLHLAWLDHCPNVVADARAAGCHIICSSDGGTKEIAGLDATVIAEYEDWNFEPTRLYEPPKMDFTRKAKNVLNSENNIKKTAKLYKNFMESVI